MIASLNAEIYLTNDVVMKAEVAPEYMYFVSSGSLAVITNSGLELMHIEDGGHFGEIGLLRPELSMV